MAIRNYGFGKGFTLVEAVVTLALVMAISAMVLFSFSGLNEGAALNRSVKELALAIRKAQHSALSVTQVTIGDPPAPVIPPAIGIRLVKGQSSYFLFGDLNPRDNMYTPALNERIPRSTATTTRNVRINEFYDGTGTPLSAVSALHITFASPEATAKFTDQGGTEILNAVQIELRTASGQPTPKRIVVRTSGQISIR